MQGQASVPGWTSQRAGPDPPGAPALQGNLPKTQLEGPREQTSHFWGKMGHPQRALGVLAVTSRQGHQRRSLEPSQASQTTQPQQLLGNLRKTQQITSHRALLYNMPLFFLPCTSMLIKLLAVSPPCHPSHPLSELSGLALTRWPRFGSWRLNAPMLLARPSLAQGEPEVWQLQADVGSRCF